MINSVIQTNLELTRILPQALIGWIQVLHYCISGEKQEEKKILQYTLEITCLPKGAKHGLVQARVLYSDAWHAI